jgi:hypothetical protein
MVNEKHNIDFQNMERRFHEQLTAFDKKVVPYISHHFTQSLVFLCVVRIWINANYLVWDTQVARTIPQTLCANKFYPGLEVVRV